MMYLCKNNVWQQSHGLHFRIASNWTELWIIHRLKTTKTLNMERTKYNNNGEFLFIFYFTNPFLACLYSFSLVKMERYIYRLPNPSPLLLTLTLESWTLLLFAIYPRHVASKSLNNIFLRYSVVSLTMYLLVLSPLTLLWFDKLRTLHAYLNVF